MPGASFCHISQKIPYFQTNSIINQGSLLGKLTLNKQELKALVEGYHGDVFSVLGIHRVVNKKQEMLLVRTLQPDAKAVTVLDSTNKRTPLNQIEGTSVFEVLLETGADLNDYTLEVEYNDGSSHIIRDPYSFPPLISDYDLQLWGEGNHTKAYEFMGAHMRELNGIRGVHFVVAAPSAARVSVVGGFNNWDGRRHVMRKYVDQGIWEIFIPGLEEGTQYKYEIKPHGFGPPFLKSDPYGFYYEKRPKTASIIKNIDTFAWTDEDWMKRRSPGRDKPVSVYELHLGSWKRHIKDNSYYTYRELAEHLIPYVTDLGYTHIELLPIAEHPYDPSWGYQITGYFAPTSRFGEPEDFMFFVNECHKNDLGVLIDWVPAHFTKDDHGLREFDGTHLYEHADPRQGEHRDWGTKIFNFGRVEVKNFLLSNALFWLEKYHIDGLRVDAVASMLYLDYSREPGDWIPNKFGGRENLEAIEFLKKFNEVAHKEFPGVVTFAEESTSWPMVSHPTYLGGLGFDYKWNMGWMNDTLKYIEVDPLYRKYHHNQLTFSLIYAFSENFILPFSHDEVVHLKKSMLSKMPGDNWQKFANLRLLMGYQYCHPGKKLLFMGSEFGQWSEWNCEQELDWPLLQFETHQGIKKTVQTLNQVYKSEKALYQLDFDWNGFKWLDFSDVDQSVISFLRFSENRDDFVICAFNFTPRTHHDYIFGVPRHGSYKEIFNSDDSRFGGSGVVNTDLHSTEGEWHGEPAHISLSLPPLGCIIIKPQ
ncbi:MAG: 1,4-alpha-glucan branching protein GlgB [Balneolaceae bacterium]|nr:MAG: 1,4-alpha-glucan branching protein GlgB [Balneolaceae bacterium]